MSLEKEIKCVIWDLDGTLWNGILLEDDSVQLKPDITSVIEVLDSRGIMHSIASRNDHEASMAKLAEFGLRDFFLYPQITWGAKSRSIARIMASLNIHSDTLLLVDDQPLERDEVNSEYPELLCMDACEYQSLPAHPRLNPRFISADSTRRRRRYLEQMVRERAQDDFRGPRREFLASLDLHLTISSAQEQDLERAKELTVRTNQLNTTGRTYSRDELTRFLSSPDHEILVCGLRDRYGDYGKIGLALIEELDDCLMLRLFLMSCRVMSLGAGSVFLSFVMQRAKTNGKKLRADFKPNDRNRAMFITMKLGNFRQVAQTADGSILLENDLAIVQQYPPYFSMALPDE